jgi:hypothetical protein
LKKIIIFLITLLISYPTFGNDYLDLDTLWVSNVGGNPIGFSHDDSQILLQFEDLANDRWVINHIDANTGEFLFFTRGMFTAINPIKDVYYSYINGFIGVFDMYNGELIDSIFLPSNLPDTYGIGGENMTVSNDGNKIAITGSIRYEENNKFIDESLILIIDIDTKKAITAINFYNGLGRYGNLPFWSKDNQYIYAMPQEYDDDYKLHKINIYNGKVVKSFEYLYDEFEPSRIQNAWLSDKGNYFFVSSGSGLFAYDSNTEEELFSFKHCVHNLDCNLIYNLISNENRNLIVSYGQSEIGIANHRDTRTWNLTNGGHINSLWYDSSSGKDTDGWRFQISNKTNTKTLFRKNELFCISNFWEDPIINSVTNQEPDIRFSEEGNFINIQTQQGDNQITISNLTGAVIQTIPINQPMQVININKQEFTSGVFFITVHSQNQVYFYKFMVVR